MSLYRALPILGMALAGVVSLSGCRTRMLVSDISQDTYEPLIDGIPFRVRETHTIRVFQWHDEIKRSRVDAEKKSVVETVEPAHFVLVMTKEVPFPNQRRLFALNFRTEQFADHTLDLTYFPDNTIRKLQLKGTPKGDGLGPLLTGATNTASKVISAEQDIALKAQEVRDAEAKRRASQSTQLQDLLEYQTKMETLRQLCLNWEEWENGDAKKLANVEDYKKERTRRLQEARTALAALMVAGAKVGQRVYEGNPATLEFPALFLLIVGREPKL